MNLISHTKTKPHNKLQLRRPQSTVAPQDSTTAKVVLKKLFSPLSKHEDSESTSKHHLSPNPLTLPTYANNPTPMTALQTKLHNKLQPRRPQSTVAPQDSTRAKVVLKKPFSPLSEHEDSESTSKHHTLPPLQTKLSPSNFTKPININGSRGALLARGQGTSSPLHSASLSPSSPLPQNFKAASKWFQLISFGIYSHPKGYEVFTRPEANEMVQHFYSLRGWISRLLGGLAITMEDTKLCGHIVKLEVRDEGLWALVKWNQNGKRLFKKKPTGFLTPIWALRADHPDIFTPFKLLKVKFSTLPPSQKTKPKIINSLKTKSLTENLMGQNNPSKNNRDHCLTLVHDHMNKTGQHYLQSWNTIKQKNPELFHS